MNKRNVTTSPQNMQANTRNISHGIMMISQQHLWRVQRVKVAVALTETESGAWQTCLVTFTLSTASRGRLTPTTNELAADVGSLWQICPVGISLPSYKFPPIDLGRWYIVQCGEAVTPYASLVDSKCVRVVLPAIYIISFPSIMLKVVFYYAWRICMVDYSFTRTFFSTFMYNVGMLTCDGGRLSMGFPRVVNKSRLKSLTFECALEVSYNKQTNLSMRLNIADDAFSWMNGCSEVIMKAAVTSGNADHVCHVRDFARPRNCEVVSDPLNAWKNGSALHRRSPHSW